MDEQVISIEEITEALKKRWKLIFLITILTTLISGIVSFFLITPQYEASTKLFIGKEEGENQKYSQNDVSLYQKLLKTYSETIKTKDLVERALEGKEISLSSGQILSNLTVVPVTDTQILQVKFKGENPEEIDKVLISITNEFIKTAKELVPNGNIRVIEQSEIPQKPISPNKKMNICIAFVIGLIISMGISFILEFLDNTYKNKEQLEREINLPVIGIIPLVDNK